LYFVKLFLAAFVISLLSCASLLLELGGMLAQSLVSAMSSVVPGMWQAAAAVLGWGV